MRHDRDDLAKHTLSDDLTSTPPPVNRVVRRLPPVDCATPLPHELRPITGPRYPSWTTAPDRPAGLVEHDEPDTPGDDGLNCPRGLMWAAVITGAAVAAVLLAWL